MYPLIRPYALRRIISCFAADDRVLVTGASGWFGRTLVQMLDSIGVPMLLLGSSDREIEFANARHKVISYDSLHLGKFRPTILVDFASLTREKVTSYKKSEYDRVNSELLSNALGIFSYDSIRLSIFSSSGVAKPETKCHGERGKPTDPYSLFKVKTESQFEQSARLLQKPAIGLRVWSVSGPLVTKPELFAFSSIVRSAVNGRIEIESRGPVYRRYCSLDDLLALALTSITSSQEFTIIESGGDLVELMDLAKLAKHLSRASCEIDSRRENSAPEHHYYSDNSSWMELSSRHNYDLESLSEQVERSLVHFRGSSSMNMKDTH